MSSDLASIDSDNGALNLSGAVNSPIYGYANEELIENVKKEYETYDANKKTSSYMIISLNIQVSKTKISDFSDLSKLHFEDYPEAYYAFSTVTISGYRYNNGYVGVKDENYEVDDNHVFVYDYFGAKWEKTYYGTKESTGLPRSLSVRVEPKS